MAIKYLIIRFSSIGDIVLTTPAVRGLKEQVDEAEVHYLTKPGYAAILNENPYIDKVHVLQSSFAKTIQNLKAEEFDYIIDLHRNLRSIQIKHKLKVMDFSFNKLNKEKWLMVNFKINKMPDEHIVDRYLKTLSVFDVKNDGKGLDYFIPASEEIEISTILPENYKEGYAAFAIGGQHATKKLPTSSIQEICHKFDKPVVLLGGKEDHQAGEIIAGNNQMIFNACGMFSLHQSASLIKKARLVITHDTGLMHIAAAFHKPVLSVWGNTIPEFGMTPYLPEGGSHMFEVRNLRCRPCTKIGYKKCPKKHFKCMKDQDINAIVRHAAKVYNTMESGQ
ncbi:MAG: glycosyltransferase family 9 protein [Candidatus Delongbacteria bacterium]|jgi:ADP-heptose:LPS heptosyltransferase|nr:glycosyltransferase family 9 protein [Candidatus Delongbacteria bacterium]